MSNLTDKMNAKQQQARRILEDALDEHRRAVDFPEFMSAALRRRICHHFALHLSDDLVDQPDGVGGPTISEDRENIVNFVLAKNYP